MNLISNLWESITATIVVVGAIIALAIFYNIIFGKKQPTEDESLNKDK
jgi:hypothetical protein